MKIDRHPDLIDRLAAEYALGVLRGGARRRLEQLARREPSVQAAIGQWQARLAGIGELQPDAEPVDKVWCGIEERLGWKPAAAPAATAPGIWQRLWTGPTFWRTTALAAALVAAIAVGLNLRLARQLESAPIADAIAVLSDDQARPAVLVTWDAQSLSVTVRRVDHLSLDAAQALQLWALPAGGKPVSLGVIGHRRELRLRVNQPIGRVPMLAVSVEPQGGSPDPNGPTGPVVFKGQVIDNTL